MKRLKRWGIFALIAALCLPLCGCRQTKTNSAEMQDDSFSVYASFFPIYALAQPIADGIDGVELNCLVQPQDGCLRSYALSDWDAALLTSAADAVIIGGSGLESFGSVLYNLGESGPAVISVLQDMPLEKQRDENMEDDRTSHWTGANPHIYMDVEAAIDIAGNIAESMAVLDPDHATAYAENLKAAEDRLLKLQTEMNTSLAGVQDEKVIVMNEALVYANAAYGLTVDLCYERESGEDVTGNDLEKCLETLKSIDAKVVLIEKQAPQSLCGALTAAGYAVAKLDTLSTGRAETGFDGYLQVQKGNVQAIIDAFSNAK